MNANREDGQAEVVPYDDLAPQDQVDRIAYDLGLEFDAALEVWYFTHPDKPEGVR